MAKAKAVTAPKRASEVKAVAAPVAAAKGPSLDQRVTELEGDLARVVDLLVKGDLDSAKFREILNKRQGQATA